MEFSLEHKKAHAILDIAWAFYIFTFSTLFNRKSGIPKGIRTPVTAVKGRCPRPLDDRDTGLTIANTNYLPDRSGDLVLLSPIIYDLSKN